MRFIARILLLLVSLAVTFTYAQTNNIPQIQHVIVVIQENRTPDNLFGSDAFAQTRQLPRADLVQQGKCGSAEIQLQSLNLGNACDPNHGHMSSWTPTYDTCGGIDWTNYVASVFPNSPVYPNSYSPILTDLGADPNQKQCDLPAVSWVVPDGSWSDHAGLDPDGAGPAWVAAIVNAVGGYNNAMQCFDTINGKQVPYWQDTVILITWDDWGGWYDHILPWRCNNVGVCSGYPSGADGGGSEYVYGFRVPLLVVSAYNYRPQGSTGYISGACVAPGDCPNEKPPYIHDFGSILNFIEFAFGTGGNPLGGTGGISPSYPYADHFAPDGHVVYPPSLYSLSDFFDFNSGPSTFTPFTQGINYKTECFINPSIEDCFGGPALRPQILTMTPSTRGSDGVFYEGGRWQRDNRRSPTYQFGVSVICL